MLIFLESYEIAKPFQCIFPCFSDLRSRSTVSHKLTHCIRLVIVVSCKLHGSESDVGRHLGMPNTLFSPRTRNYVRAQDQPWLYGEAALARRQLEELPKCARTVKVSSPGTSSSHIPYLQPINQPTWLQKHLHGVHL